MEASIVGATRLWETSVVDLVTFKKDGTPVRTRMLSTPRHSTLLLRTHHTAGKLKRLRDNPSVEVGPSTGWGRPLGATQRGTARILPAAEVAECLELLHRRHGLVGRASTWLRHRYGHDVFIEVCLI